MLKYNCYKLAHVAWLDSENFGQRSKYSRTVLVLTDY
jgi:hypothetical protein